MATSGARGRKAPKRKRGRYKIRGKWIAIEYFKGYELRHMQPDLDIFFWRGDGTVLGQLAERNTLWIDDAYRAEEEFLVRVYEIQTMPKWSTRGDNKRYPPYQAQRAELKKKLCLSPPVPDVVVHKYRDEERQLDIAYVRGDLVRLYHDPHFVFGGHDLIYPDYVPRRTVWIDVCQDEREKPFSLHHELFERELMEKGLNYKEAHAAATKSELALRLEEYRMKRLPTPKPQPLPLVAIEQGTDAGCGPTSLKMAVDHDGYLNPQTAKPWTEQELIVLSECDPDLGTDHGPLAKAAIKIAGEDRVVHGEGGDIKLLRRVVNKERRPVMVGWWNGPHRTEEEVRADNGLDEGHYAVVKHVTRTHVVLADPWILADPGDPDSDGAPGDRRIPIKEFKQRWYDMDVGFVRVEGWFLYLKPRTESKIA